MTVLKLIGKGRHMACRYLDRNLGLMLLILLFIIGFGSLPSVKAASESQIGDFEVTTLRISGSVLGAAQSNCSNGIVHIAGTTGQVLIGTASDDGAAVNSGFWHMMTADGNCCVGEAGNVDSDETDQVDLSDLIFLVNYLFLGGSSPDCIAEGNVDGDSGCSVDLSDLIYLVNYLFLGGPSPFPCLSECR